MKDKVSAVLDKIRPTLVADGGDVELVDVSDGTVKVKLSAYNGLRNKIDCVISK